VINIVKKVTNIKNIYTYFEFKGYGDRDDFDRLLSILTGQIGCEVLEMLDGIYSKHCVLKKDNFIFKLMYHEDFGNCLCNQDEKDNDYYAQLEKIADEVVCILINISLVFDISTR
jgi:hypothetical protein